MNEKHVPYIVWEGERARDERKHRRDFIVILVLIAALLLSNAIWVYVWIRSPHTAVTAGDGIANYIGHDGEITNGSQPDAN